MEKSLESKDDRSKRDSPDIFTLAMTVGFFVFLVTGDLDGGLTAVQGFFVGFFSVYLLIFLAIVIDGRQARSREQYKTSLSLPGNVTITPIESESGITIQIYVSRHPVSSREAGNG